MPKQAKALVRDLIAEYDMPCPFRPGILHACWTKAETREAHIYAEKLARDYGYDQLEPLDRAALQAVLPTPVYHGGELDHGAGHIHPLNFAIGLAKAAAVAGARIHENTHVVKIDPGMRPVVHTDSASITCDHVILACNGYLGG